MKQSTFRVLCNHEPRIMISRELLEQVRYFVRKVTAKECQWFHRITKTVVNGAPVYTLSEIVIPEQDVTGGTVESDPARMFKMASEIKKQFKNEEGVLDNDAFNEYMSNLACWCHSHVQMAAHPSGTDNTQFKEQLENAYRGGQTCPQMMIIFNQKDEIFTRVYDPETGLIYEHVKMIIDEPDIDMNYIDDAIKNKLKTKTYPMTRHGMGSHHSQWLGKTNSGSHRGQHHSRTNAFPQTVSRQVETDSGNAFDVDMIMPDGDTITGIIKTMNDLEASKCNKLAESLATITDTTLDEPDYYAANILLTNSGNMKVLELATGEYLKKISTQGNKHRTNFKKVVAGHRCDPITFLDVIRTVIQLNFTNSSESLQLLEPFLSNEAKPNDNSSSSSNVPTS